MRRRDLILGLGAAIGTLPAARAQQKSMPRVGVLVYGNPQIDRDAESFRRGMRDLGYADGENIVLNFAMVRESPIDFPRLRKHWFAANRRSCLPSAVTYRLRLWRPRAQFRSCSCRVRTRFSSGSSRALPAREAMQLGSRCSWTRSRLNGSRCCARLPREYRKLPSFITPTTSTMSVGRPAASHSHSVLAVTL